MADAEESNTSSSEEEPLVKLVQARKRQREDSEEAASSSEESSGESESSEEEESASDVRSNEDPEVDEWAEDLMGGDEDRRKLAVLPEVERERILTDRYERRKRVQERRSARLVFRKQKKRKEKLKRPAKRPRMTARQRVKHLTSKQQLDMSRTKALSDLQQRRTRQQQRSRLEVVGEEQLEEEVLKEGHVRKAREVRRGKKKVRTEEEEEEEEEAPVEAEEEEEEEEEADKEKRIEWAKRTPIGFKHVTCVLLRRKIAEKLFLEPYFPQFCNGMFCRISIGKNAEGQNKYRMCEVLGTGEYPREYSLNAFKTKVGMRVRFGKHERVFNLDALSNRRVSEEEFVKWKTQMEADDLEVPCLEDLIARKNKAERLQKTFVYSSKDVKEMLKRKAADLRKAKHLNVNLARFKNDIVFKIKELQAVEKAKRTPEMETSLRRLQNRLDELKEVAERQRSMRLAERDIAQQSLIQKINRQSKLVNRSREKQPLHRESSGGALDPFARTKTRIHATPVRKLVKRPPVPVPRMSREVSTASVDFVAATDWDNLCVKKDKFLERRLRADEGLEAIDVNQVPLVVERVEAVHFADEAARFDKVLELEAYQIEDQEEGL